MRQLLYHTLDDEKIKPRFDELMDAIYVLYELDWEREESKISELPRMERVECLLMSIICYYPMHNESHLISCASIIFIFYNYCTEAFNRRIRCEVSANPILCKIVSQDFLLMAACGLDQEWSHHSIKYLIEMNPSALIWTCDGESPIYKIASHPQHCVLMPWVAAKYRWVLESKQCIERPPAFFLIANYASRVEGSKCTAATIQHFFSAFPRGLRQEDNYGTPLHRILRGTEECQFGIFKWIADAFPGSMMKVDKCGWTPLHIACMCLKKHHSTDICRYLVNTCPESVRLVTNGSTHLEFPTLPIHFVAGRCHHRSVQEVALLLLRKYPRSADMAASTHPKPRSNPFIRRVMPYLDEERELLQNISHLQEIPGAFHEATALAKDSLVRSACVAFDSWSTSFLQVLEAQMEYITRQIQDVCDEFDVDRADVEA